MSLHPNTHYGSKGLTILHDKNTIVDALGKCPRDIVVHHPTSSDLIVLLEISFDSWARDSGEALSGDYSFLLGQQRVTRTETGFVRRGVPNTCMKARQVTNLDEFDISRMVSFLDSGRHDLVLKGSRCSCKLTIEL